MAKPRVFVSSTYFDLKHIRRNIEIFIEQMGYEPVLFESGDIPFEDKVPLDISCYKEIENCHIQILILGGRYGASASQADLTERLAVDSKYFDFYNSITKTEYLKARQIGIPVFIFVQKGVLAEYETYKKNRENTTIVYAHADSVNIFKLLDDIFGEKAGNYVKDFENFDDIQNWLKEQWAGLFANYLSKRASEQQIKTLSTQVNELSAVVNSLKEYSEAIMRTIKPVNYERIIKEQEEKLKLLAQYTELLDIDYIRHLTSVHNLNIENIHSVLIKAKSFDEFKSEIYDLLGKEIKCIERGYNIKEINIARKSIGLPVYSVSISDNEQELSDVFDKYFSSKSIKPIKIEKHPILGGNKSTTKNKVTNSSKTKK